VQLVADAIAAGVAPGKALVIVEAIHANTAEIAREVVGVLDASIESYDELEHGDVIRRGRSLLAQSVATVVVHQVGARLIDAAKDRPDLAKLLDEVRIGVVRSAAQAPGGAAPELTAGSAKQELPSSSNQARTL
jgi:hypothetical protein